MGNVLRGFEGDEEKGEAYIKESYGVKLIKKGNRFLPLADFDMGFLCKTTVRRILEVFIEVIFFSSSLVCFK
ncbi:hypothetical protein ACMUMQ_03085 [Marinomonas sp. 2405UD66-6]|uniref:hypothetical protein n=1 Tax=Marinomonas sp. 2405UD66-6 TaxID=3391834 RepID=UPI0039C9753F